MFTLAEMATEIAIAREFTDRAIMEHCAGRLTSISLVVKSPMSASARYMLSNA